jgi:REP element-mobilizing transposase RayT
MSTWHITLATTGRETLFVGEAALREAVLALDRAVGAALLLFCIVDDHVHIVIEGDRRQATNAARAVSLAFRFLRGRGLAPAHIRPVESRAHLQRLVSYVAGNAIKHKVAEGPAWAGSCLLDLIGARVLPRFRPARLTTHLPRLSLDAHGLPGWGTQPASRAFIRQCGAGALARAAAAATCADPRLTGNAPPIVLARRATAVLGRAAGIPDGEIAYAMGCHRRSARRLRAATVEREVLSAVRVRLALAPT